MEIQNQIKRVLSEPERVEYIRGLLEGGGFESRTQLAGFLCEQLDLHDPRGQLQRSGCLKALRELEKQGYFQLPAPLIQKGGPAPRRGPGPIEEPVDVPEQVGEVRGLELILVSSEQEREIWNELILREHPQGNRPLVGRQLRYLIGSEHGWLGALGFGAPALQLADRDRWIGWQTWQRQAHLHGLVCLNRFLIRSSVSCQNLASRVLSLMAGRLPGDFELRYGYRPWLVESFVDTTRFSGACYRAANWIRVGQTRGRGRQDRFTQRGETIKDIYVYPLEKDFRARLGLPEGAGLGPLTPAEGVDTDHWAEQEFGDAPLGDERLSRRLVAVAQEQAQEPGRAYSGVAQGDRAAVKGYYRLIDHPDTKAVNLEHIMQPHREQTIRRMQGQRTVLAIHDGSDLNYTTLAQCEGLGVIGTNQTQAESRGLHLHSTLVVTPQGLPLGVLRAQCWAPPLKSPQEKRASWEIPIEEKPGSFCWIEGLRDLLDLAPQMPQTRVISVSDREADFFELFDEQRRRPVVDLLVRAQHSRRLVGEDLNLFETLRGAPVQAQIAIQVPRQSARPKLSKRKARPKRPGRRAYLSVRYQPVQLRPPDYHQDKKAIEIWVVHAWEEKPSEGTEAVEWFLLTTLPIHSPEQAVQCLRWYCLRWRIEDWHRVLKSGCRIEDLTHHSAERLVRAIGIRLVIAWRIMLMTLLGRQSPELPAEVLFSDLEIQVLRAYAKKKG